MEPVAAALSALVVSSGALEPDAQQEAVLAQLQASGVLADIDADRADKIAMGMLFECKAIQKDDATPEARVAAVAAELERLLGVARVGSDGYKVPKVRFGRTEIMMPVISCGGMRMQQSWGRSHSPCKTMAEVTAECQDNFVAIIRRAIELGINHFETARGYGCSEMQYGAALRALIDSGEVKREDIIVQTKGPVKPSADAFKHQFEKSMAELQLDYIDVFSFHGINTPVELARCLEHCLPFMLEQKKAGRVRSIGFSTHGMAGCILEAIETDAFDYINIHFHWCGSYTASGSDPATGGNLACLQACQKRDMGIFIISPFDKGGMVYNPSIKLRSLMRPDLDPVAYSALYLWHHEQAPHTLVVGAARPSDLDETTRACQLHYKTEEGLARTARVRTRLAAEVEKTCGEGWSTSWWKGLPLCFTPGFDGIYYTQLVWLSTLLRAFGMYTYARERYKSSEGNRRGWDKDEMKVLPFEQRLKKASWSWGPGNSFLPGTDMTAALSECPEPEKVKAAVLQAHEALRSDHVDALKPKLEELGWAPAFDLRPWTAYPDAPVGEVKRAAKV